jgi:hypothetical protein
MRVLPDLAAGAKAAAAPRREARIAVFIMVYVLLDEKSMQQ